jgi:hypothetical protein
MPQLLTVHVSVFVRSGSQHESKALNGVSHFVEHMAFKGTATRDCQRINLDAERLGAEVNAHTDRDHTAFHMHGLPEHTGAFVQMLADIVRAGSFPQAELERERQVILQEYAEDDDDALSAAFKLFDKTCFGDHPVARPVIGHRRNIERFTRDDPQDENRRRSPTCTPTAKRWRPCWSTQTWPTAAGARGQRDRYALLGDFRRLRRRPGWVVDRVRAMAPRAPWRCRATTTPPPCARRVAGHARRGRAGDRLDPRRSSTPAQLGLPGQPAADGPEVDEVLFVHANAWAPADWEYVEGRGEAVRSLHATRQRLTFCGHMHEPRLYHLSPTGKAGDFVPTPGIPIPLLRLAAGWSSPGSAGQPRDGDPAACYAVYDHDSSAAHLLARALRLRGRRRQDPRRRAAAALADRLAHGT